MVIALVLSDVQYLCEELYYFKKSVISPYIWMKKIMREITCGFVDKNPGFFCFIGEEDM